MSNVFFAFCLGHDFMMEGFLDHFIGIQLCVWIIDDQIWKIGATDINTEIKKDQVYINLDLLTSQAFTLNLAILSLRRNIHMQGSNIV